MKMTIFVFCLLSIIANDMYGQTKFNTNKGVISFKSNADLELISGFSENVRGLLDVNSYQFAFTIDVNSFKGFNNELQREHFLEKYMEVDKYANAYFSGKIIEQIDFT